jgi:dTDP-4-dehydrorhamnose 3,5-epimerase
MQVEPTDIPDVLLLRPRVFEDQRGFFMEAFQARTFAELGLPTTFVQDNVVGSQQGVLRGLHYQIWNAQGKLVRVALGEIFDVAVDLRRSSPTFSRWVGLRLKAEDKAQIWIPPGFAHGYYVLSPWAEVSYKVTDYYTPEAERTLRWDDPDLDIQWPLLEGKAPVLSAKDARGRALAEADLFP